MLTQERLKELLHYDPETGVMTWLKRPRSYFKTIGSYKTWNTKFAGRITGVTEHRVRNGKMYSEIGVFNKKHLSHRIIWLYMTGNTPLEVDHINGDGTDNRWCNLREVSRQDNCRNVRRVDGSKSKCTGVTWDSVNCKWLTRIKSNGVTKNLGRYSDLGEAVRVRKSAEIQYGFHKNHGSDRPL